MKCSEAVEWMHRYIDDDLSRDESSALIEHIQRCSDCNEEFTMLKELSARLEELPIVAPRYSLVDAILPQLEAIDLGRREGGSTLEEAPAATMAAAPELLNRRRERSSGRSRAYRTGAFGLAAALILGVFIYQVEPRTVPDAEIASQTAQDMSDNSAASILSEEALQDTAQESLNSQEAATDGTQGEATQDALPEVPEAEAPAAGGDNTSTASDDRSSAGGSQNTDAGTSKGIAAQKPNSQDSKQAGSSSSSGQNSTKQGTGKAANNEKAAGNDAAADSDHAVSDEAVADLPPLRKDAAITGEEADLQEGRIMMGIAGFAALNEWTSPDGAFLVKYLDGHLYLYRNDFSESTIVTDVPVDGNWVSGEWSEDGTIFNYLVEKDGVSSSYSLQPVRQ